MSIVAVPSTMRAAPAVSGPVLAGGMSALAVAAALLAGWTPILFSIVTVFLFAGPHNWLEARYFLTRLPARWGKLRPFFLVAFAGMFALTGFLAALPWLADRLGPALYPTLVAGWDSAIVGWVAVLVLMRARTNPRRAWDWIVPVAFLLIAVAWLAPYSFSLALVYLHPLMALWLLDRELKRSRPAWRPAYHACLAAVPLLLAAIWWNLWNAPPLPGDTTLQQAITSHAGADRIDRVSSHVLVATHTFLEMVHYGVWIVAIPLVGIRISPLKLDNVPMARRGAAWRAGIVGLLAGGAFVALVLWVCFGIDYATTRQVYFTVAMLHVLAEVPFLLRAL
jgi:hypothetical protein